MKKTITVAILSIAFSSLLAQKKPAFDLKGSIAKGKEIYQANCVTCHLETGEGIEGVYPPLAKSDYLMADKKRAAQLIIRGLNGPIQVKKIPYDAEMTKIDLKDEELSDVLNYIRNSWGNKGEAVSSEEVKTFRN